jgi:CRP-like cAMP-binding protein
MRLRRATKLDLLGKVPLFAGCSKRELGEIARVADEIDIPEGRTLITEGQHGREFFVIVDGTARVSRNGRKVNDLGPGDWAGEIALIANTPRTATVVSTSPVRLLVVTDRAFRDVLEKVPSIATKLMGTLGERLHTTAI